MYVLYSQELELMKIWFKHTNLPLIFYKYKSRLRYNFIAPNVKNGTTIVKIIKQIKQYSLQ
jgi:hypothetical protein